VQKPRQRFGSGHIRGGRMNHSIARRANLYTCIGELVIGITKGQELLTMGNVKPQNPIIELGKGHGEVQKDVRKEEETYGLGQMFIRDSTRGSKKLLRLNRKEKEGG
jgi:hypothetical protein